MNVFASATLTWLATIASTVSVLLRKDRVARREGCSWWCVKIHPYDIGQMWKQVGCASDSGTHCPPQAALGADPRPKFAGQACVLAMALGLLVGLASPTIVRAAELPEAGMPLTAARAHRLGYSLTPSDTEPYAVCRAPKQHLATCMSTLDPTAEQKAQARAKAGSGSGTTAVKAKPATEEYEGTGREKGYSPTEIREAYAIPSTGGANQTVAIVDAYNDPTAESDLTTYRKEYGLPECTKANGCFRKINQKGEEANYPSDKYPIYEYFGEKIIEDWGVEISLDVDMVSAICPECHILLVEANNNSELFSAEAEAEKYELEEAGTKKKVATEISNSWGGYTSEYHQLDEKYFEHAGIPITAGSGDSGYNNGELYPAASPYVIAVGGTQLNKAAKTEENPRGWTEKVWPGSGGGCNTVEEKPAWQHDPFCPKRMDNDVAAVASTQSPVSVYDSYKYEEDEASTGTLGWVLLGGTSVATPIIAGIEAHASSAVREEGPKAFYTHTLFGVTSGSDGEVCGEVYSYFCTAGEGYDGPAGWGAPDGALATTASLSAVTESAGGVTAAQAVLRGYVNPGGAETSYHFEYGPTTSYGTSAPIPNGDAGTGMVWEAVSATVALPAEGTYHYRLVATNSSGTKYGKDHVFSTIPWGSQTPVELEGGSRLNGVSCSPSAVCVTVGEYSYAHGDYALAEGWTEGKWSMQATPEPLNANESRLLSVACRPLENEGCIAVGYFKESGGDIRKLAETWNAKEKSWSLALSGLREDGELTSVACYSPTACMAVGHTSSYGLPVAEQWNGKEWSEESVNLSRPVEEEDDSRLTAIACQQRESSCVAVGTRYRSGRPLSVVWSGEDKWEEKPLAEGEGSLDGVSCWASMSSAECMAVGNKEELYCRLGECEEAFYIPTSTAELWNGSKWSIDSPPKQEWVPNSLNGISCWSGHACTAVGYHTVGTYGNPSGDPNHYEDANEARTYADHWNGTEWTVEATPYPEEIIENRSEPLMGVSCVPAVCMAVGRLSELGFVRSRITYPVGETMPATGVGVERATLHGNVKPDETEAKYYFEYGPTITYGTKTAKESAGSGSGVVEESDTITGLALGTTYHYRIVVTNGAATVYGEDHTFSTAQWAIQATPNPAGVKVAELIATSCPSLSECMAVGAAGGLLSEWRAGTEWSIVAVPNPTGAKHSELRAVSCSSSMACTAVGSYENSAGTTVTLAERWNGSEWSVQSTPNPAEAKTAALAGVSCSSSTACTAVGSYENSAGTTAILAERWNGSAWSTQSAPSPAGTIYGGLHGVSCASSTACTAVGVYATTRTVKGIGYVRQSLAEGWNGTEWSVEAQPAFVHETSLASVSCVSMECVAVGSVFGDPGAGGVAERWSDKEWRTLSTPAGASEKWSAVSCVSASFCEAIAGGVPERWNGTEWHAQIIEGEEVALEGVSCTSTTVCAAVGSETISETPPSSKTIAEVYS